MTRKYIVPGYIVCKLEALDIGASALKLVHGLLLHAALQVNGETKSIWMGMKTEALVRTSFLRTELGWESQKGNRPLKVAIADPSLKPILKSVTLTPNGRGVRREFQRRFIEICASKYNDTKNAKSKYALMETASLGQCRTREDVLLLTRVLMHQRQDYPKFSIAGVGRREQTTVPENAKFLPPTHRNVCAGSEHTATDKALWTNSRSKWLTAARRVSEITGSTLLLRGIEGIAVPGVIQVEVLISSSKSKWTPEVFFKTGGCRRLILVTGKGYRNISTKEAKAGAAGKEVPGQGF